MNIFVLNECPEVAASMMCDKHVIKMILETSQLLSTAHHILDGANAIQGIYKKTHHNHPSAVWVRKSSENYIWTLRHLNALCEHYTRRYRNVHKTESSGISTLLASLPKNIPEGSLTRFAMAMPDVYKTSCPVESYLNYYVYDKTRMLEWTDVPPPSAIKNHKGMSGFFVGVKNVKIRGQACSRWFFYKSD